MARKSRKKSWLRRNRWWVAGGLLGVGLMIVGLVLVTQLTGLSKRQPAQAAETYEEQQARLRNQAVAAWWAMQQQAKQAAAVEKKKGSSSNSPALTPGAAIQVVHVSDITNLRTLANFSTTNADIESISSAGYGYFVFYRTTDVKYEYRTVSVSEDVGPHQIFIGNSLLTTLLQKDWVVADAARLDGTWSDQRIFLLKQRSDGRAIGGVTSQPVKVASIVSPHFVDMATELSERLGRNVAIHSFSEWDPYEVVYSDTAPGTVLEYQVQTHPLSAVPATDVSAIMMRIQQETVDGWQFLKADLQDGWQDDVVLIFARQISTQ